MMSFVVLALGILFLLLLIIKFKINTFICVDFNGECCWLGIGDETPTDSSVNSKWDWLIFR